MSKITKYGDEAYEIIKKGVEEQRLFVGATLGPRAHNILFDRPFGTPAIVHDGVTVSKELDPSDPFEATVHKVVKDAAKQTNDEAGDGTTTATILTHSLFTEGRRLVSSGHNAQMLRKGVEAATEKAIYYLRKSSQPITTSKQQLEVAIIASQNERIGSEVARAFEKLGNDAVISIEESKHTYIYSEYKDGMEIDQGYISRFFITNEFEEAVVEDAHIIVTDYNLASIVDIQQLFETLTQLEVKDNLVIIAPEVKEIALNALVQNKLHGLHILAVRAPSYGDEQSERLEDIAISVGGSFISREAGRTLEAVIEEMEVEGDTPSNGIRRSDIGHASKVVALKDSTTIVNGSANSEKLKARVETLKKRLKKETTSEFESERLHERIAKLTSGVAIINVGDRNDAVAKEYKERAIDAKGAIQAANKGGIVAGGETALLRAALSLADYKFAETDSEEFKAGFKLVERALEAPFKTLMDNSGLDGGQMLERLLQVRQTWPVKGEIPNLGVDAIDGLVKDLVKAGVIDPVLVPISALQNAVSASMGLLTTGGIIVDEKKDRDADVV